MNNFEIVNIPSYLNASKSKDFRSQIFQQYTSIFKFLYDKNLIKINPLNELGEVKEDLIVYKSDLTENGLELFKKAIPSWQRNVDRSGNYENISSLEKALAKLCAEAKK